MNKASNVPQIRFKGFTDAWEQRKLGTIAESTYGGGTPKTTIEEYWNGGIPWIQSSDIQENQFFNIQVRKTISEEGLANSAAKLIPKNSIAIVTRVGVGKLGLIPFDFTTSQDFLSFSELNIDSHYAVYLLFKKLQFESKMVQGTSIKGITKEELLSKDLKISQSDLEQKYIGQFFQKIDNLITLHQRKYDQVVNFKKAMLEKMFPKNGSDTPEIRFKEFSEKSMAPWIKKNLKDESLEIIAGGDINTSLLKNEGEYPVIANALTFNGIVGFYDNYFRVKAPAVTVTGRGDVGHAKARLVDFTPVVRLISLKSNHNVFFLENSINTLNIVVESTGVPQLTVPQLSKYDLYFPPTIHEEEVVGEFFNNIDTLINSYHCNLQKLKNIKKALLEKMFVQEKSK